jgi:hypothetical protein
MNEKSAALIEDEVARRIACGECPAMEHLSAGFATIEGGRRYVEIVEIKDNRSGDTLAMYGVKDAQGSEPESAIRASKLEIGPRVLLVTEDEVILEEYFDPDLNVRRRKPREDEFHHFGEHLADFFKRFVLHNGQGLIRHRDERSEHIFIIGSSKDIEVRLVDWGRSGVWPPERFNEWGMEQFRWFYLELSVGSSEIWRTFIDSLASDFPTPHGKDALSKAYLRFVRHQLSPLSDRTRRSHATNFLEFLVRCGRLGLDLGFLNEFVEEHTELRGRELVEKYMASSG